MIVPRKVKTCPTLVSS